MTLRGSLFRASRALRRDRRFKLFCELVASERLPVKTLHSIQAERLSSLLRHANHTVPFYQKTLKKFGVVDRDGTTVDLKTFRTLPLLERKVIRANFRDLISQTPPERPGYRYVVSTGGTTGEPLRISRDGVTDQWIEAVGLWFDSWCGYHIGERKINLVFDSRLFERPLRFGQVRRSLGRWLRGELTLDCRVMSDVSMERYANLINRFRPVQLCDGIPVCALLADPSRAQILGEKGRQAVRERFSDETLVRQTERLYLDLAIAKGIAGVVR